MLRFSLLHFRLAMLLVGALPATNFTIRAEEVSFEAKVREKWSAEIAKLTALNPLVEPNNDAILFVGSSSIRLWDEIAADMAPYVPIQRGYGGAKFSDVAIFAEELISPHRYRALVLFVGNDVSGKEDDATPEQVVGWFQKVVSASKAARPDAPVFCIAVTPTPKRWEAWPEIQALNEALISACEADPQLHFIPTAASYLGDDGNPRAELFREDQLHQSRLGYEIWSGIIKSQLEAVLGQ